MTRIVFAAATGFACLVAIGRATPAFADPTRLVIAPAGWRADPEQATALAQRFAATGHFGGLPAVTAAEAYVADRPGIALFATRATATLPGEPPQAARVTRAALDELRASSQRGSLTGGTAEERSWHERADAGLRQVTATLAWSDPTSHTVETARVVVASDGKRIVAVTGECLASDAADPVLVAACQTALASLDPGVAAASRVALTLAPASDAAAFSPVAAAFLPVAAASSHGGTAAAHGGTPASPSRESARLDDASKIELPPMRIPQDRRAEDRRTVYVGAGLIAIAVMFWWNRRRRDRFEREDRGEPAAPAPRDDDGDDLHAAARGDGPDRPEPPDRPDRQDRQGNQ